MKKFYALSMGLLLGTAGAFAADLSLGDFEDQSLSSWGNWGGANTIVANPYSNTENSSSYVMKYVPAAEWNGISLSKSGVVNGDFISVNVDVYCEEDVTIQMILNGSASKGADYVVSKSIPAGAWYHLCFDINALTLRDYGGLVFQNSVVSTIYFDNIRIVSGTPDLSKKMLMNFEEGLIDSWGSWQPTTPTIEANPAIGAVNGSAKSVKLVTTDEWGSLKKWYGSIFISAKPSKLSVKVYASVASKVKLQMDNPVVALETATIEKFLSVANASEWTVLEYDLSELSYWEYKQLAFQPEKNGTFYFDDITVYYSSGSSEVIEIKSQMQAEIFTCDSSISILNSEGASVEIYTMTGVKVAADTNIGSEYSVAVGKGTHVVVVNGVAQKVLVK